MRSSERCGLHSPDNRLEDNRSYDLQGRLINQKLTDAPTIIIDQRTYTYDKNSDILNIDTNTEDNSNQIAHIDTFQRGAILSDLSDREMIYNDAGRLYQLIEANILKSEYIYNDMGQRTRKTIYQPDGTTIDSVTIYYYEQMDMLVTETNVQGNLIKDYIWQEGMMPMVQIDNNQDTESIIYLYTDHLMTNRLATDDTQQVVWRWEGEAFGNTPAEGLGGVSVNLRFPGQYYDQETNLHHNYFRYYDPQLGRYTTSDPIGLQGGMNKYLYTYANPIKFTDPFGLRRPYDENYGPDDSNCTQYSTGRYLLLICNGEILEILGIFDRPELFDNPWVNCSRKCLQAYNPIQYDGPWLDRFFWYLPQHPICWWVCTDDDGCK